jgi:uncharacterized membrane protein YpjA/uncharacterized membrane protein YdjX (TVP38/TMEM64 family)
MSQVLIDLMKEHMEISYVLSIIINILISFFAVVPSFFLTAANIIVFGFWEGAFLSLVGEVIGSIVSFQLYRKGIRKFIPNYKSKHKYLERLLSTKGIQAFTLILSLRLLPFVPSGLINIGAAFGRVSALTFGTATLIGKVPALLFESYTVSNYLAWEGEGKVALTLLGVILIAGYFAFDKLKKEGHSSNINLFFTPIKYKLTFCSLDLVQFKGVTKMNLLYNYLGDKRFITFLILVNFIGTVYGYYWYRYQIQDTPAKYILFVPDSPTASLFFLIALIGLVMKRNIRIIEALAVITLFKYGVWAVVMNILVLIELGTLHWTGYMLILSHGAMAIQGLLYTPYFRYSVIHIVIASIWTLHNDVIDYVFFMLPSYSVLSSYIPQIGYFTFWLSMISIGLAFYLKFKKKATSLLIN